MLLPPLTNPKEHKIKGEVPPLYPDRIPDLKVMRFLKKWLFFFSLLFFSYPGLFIFYLIAIFQMSICVLVVGREGFVGGEVGII